jgi:peptidylprolyl isomerase
LLALALATMQTAGCRWSRRTRSAVDRESVAAVTAPARDPNAPADVGAPPPEATKTTSGLTSRVLAAGNGTEHPGAEDSVSVRYTGWTTGGIKFGGSGEGGTPALFPVAAVIKGWAEGLQLMVVGEKRRLWIPAGLAFGTVSSRPDAPAGMLVYDVELLGIDKAPPVPDHLARPPRSARKTSSGLIYQVLQEGSGTEHASLTSMVQVHYTGWTPDGEMFDSSVARGRPPTFPLGGVMPGWTEGLQLMVVGEKTRFWLPAKLAYGEKPGSPGNPPGAVVFDLELLAIK